MTTYIAVLRGINVGGKRIIKMEALRQLCSSLGFTNCKTYIQSGNIIFQYPNSITQLLAAQLCQAINSHFLFEVPTIVIELQQLKEIVTKNPFINDSEKQKACFHVTFLSDAPSQAAINSIKDKIFQDDAFQIFEQAVYLYCPNGYSNSKLTNGFFEKKLGVNATTRNWATTIELLQLAEGIM